MAFVSDCVAVTGVHIVVSTWCISTAFTAFIIMSARVLETNGVCRDLGFQHL